MNTVGIAICCGDPRLLLDRALMRDQLQVDHLFLMTPPGSVLGLTTNPQQWGVAAQLRTYTEVAQAKYGVTSLVIGMYSHLDCGAHGGAARIGDAGAHCQHFTRTHIEAMAEMRSQLADLGLTFVSYVIESDGRDTVIDHRQLGASERAA